MSIQYIIGDVFKVMKTLDDDSVDLILTSPPFLALRSYLPANHPDKGKEIGSEATPAEYIDVLLRLTAEWRRLLAPHGSLVVELGDTFSGSGGGGGDYLEGGWREGQQNFAGSNASMRESNAAHWRQKNQWRVNIGEDGEPAGGRGTRSGRKDDWPLAKSLTLIPESYRFALVYGINPHTGATSPAGQWRVRNVIRWVRPNPPVGALGDKFRPATSELVVACTSKDRYFDLDAVREPFAESTEQRVLSDAPVSIGVRQADGGRSNTEPVIKVPAQMTQAGAPPLDWWKISPKGYSGAHYAVWPSELCVKPIKAMCPVKVCRTCGEPSRRITESEPLATREVSANTEAREDARKNTYQSNRPDGQYQVPAFREGQMVTERRITTLGWSDCGHNDYRAGMVLDPFAGTGTTLAVAHGHGRDAIGIDIDERSAELARDRVGPLFLEIV